MSERVDIEVMIKAAPVGAMVYGRFGEDPDPGQWQTGFLIREHPARVRALGKEPRIEQRGGLIYENEIALVCALLEIGRELYESWFNWFGADNREAFLDLAAQERLAVLFYSDEKRIGALSTRNGFRDLFTRATSALAAAKPWTMREFDQAREGVYSHYATVRVLWRALADSKTTRWKHGRGN